MKAYLMTLAGDERLAEYIWDVAENCEGEKDVHNVDEVAACCRFLRMCHVYQFDSEHVRRYIKMAESLALDSLDGKRCYRLTPSQVFVICGMHGFIDEKEVELYGKKQTEARKVVQESILCIPRKWSKTQIDAWEVEPFDSKVSETQRIAYGKSSLDGITGKSALSASAPCPISRRPGPLDGFVSPTE